MISPLTLSVTLADGSSLRIDTRPSPPLAAFLRQRTSLGAIAGLLLLTVLGFTLRRHTRASSARVSCLHPSSARAASDSRAVIMHDHLHWDISARQNYSFNSRSWLPDQTEEHLLRSFE